MPERKTVERARKLKREGKSPSTQAGEFVREEIEHVREGKHGARSAKQAIAIGLSKARRAGVKLPARGKGATTEKPRRGAVSKRRSRASLQALKKEGRRAASKRALGAHARAAAGARTASERSASARKAARTRTRREH
jgi:hypothetical protein